MEVLWKPYGATRVHRACTAPGESLHHTNAPVAAPGGPASFYVRRRPPSREAPTKNVFKLPPEPVYGDWNAR